MILDAMREAGAEPGVTVMIGDTSYDIEMARAAGVTSIGVTWGYHAEAVLKACGADHIVSVYAELAASIDGLLFAPQAA